MYPYFNLLHLISLILAVSNKFFSDGPGPHHPAAARRYTEVKLHRNAVKLFELAMMHTEAALHCFHNNLLDEAVFEVCGAVGTSIRRGNHM